MRIAMQYVRYIPAPETPPSCLPPNSTIPSSDPRVSSLNPMQVVCTISVFPTQSRTRVVDFYACPTTATQLSCQTTAFTLRVEVAYNDLNGQGVDDCYATQSAPPVTTSCG